MLPSKSPVEPNKGQAVCASSCAFPSDLLWTFALKKKPQHKLKKNKCSHNDIISKLITEYQRQRRNSHFKPKNQIKCMLQSMFFDYNAWKLGCLTPASNSKVDLHFLYVQSRYPGLSQSVLHGLTPFWCFTLQSVIGKPLQQLTWATQVHVCAFECLPSLPWTPSFG